MLGLAVCGLDAPYLAKALAHAPVEFHSAEARPVRLQRRFLFRREHVFVEHPLVRRPWLVVLALVALAVRALLLRHEHLARAEEVSEVRPVVAELGELVLQRGAVEPGLSEELSPRRPVLLLDVGVVVAVPRPGPPQERLLRLASQVCRDMVVQRLAAVVGMQGEDVEGELALDVPQRLQRRMLSPVPRRAEDRPLRLPVRAVEDPEEVVRGTGICKAVRQR